jgi:hypothetical protein
MGQMNALKVATWGALGAVMESPRRKFLRLVADAVALPAVSRFAMPSGAKDRVAP